MQTMGIQGPNFKAGVRVKKGFVEHHGKELATSLKKSDEIKALKGHVSLDACGTTTFVNASHGCVLGIGAKKSEKFLNDSEVSLKAVIDAVKSFLPVKKAK
jgi:hypothetical protein